MLSAFVVLLLYLLSSVQGQFHQKQGNQMYPQIMNVCFKKKYESSLNLVARKLKMRFMLQTPVMFMSQKDRDGRRNCASVLFRHELKNRRGTRIDMDINRSAYLQKMMSQMCCALFVFKDTQNSLSRGRILSKQGTNLNQASSKLFISLLGEERGDKGGFGGS